MDLKESFYTVLIVSSNEKFNEQLKTVLPQNTFGNPVIAKTVGEAKRILLEREFDITLINSPLTDEFGTDLAIDLCHDGESGVLQFVRSELYDEIYDKTNEYGVLLVEKPVLLKAAYQSIRLACATIERIRRMKKNNVNSLKEKLEEIKLVDTAKLLLIEHKKFTEEEAHRYLEKRAMDLRKTKRACALDVINEYKK